MNYRRTSRTGRKCLGLVVTLSLSIHAAAYIVSPRGEDSDGRSGKTDDAAWRSLAYACDRAGANDTIRLLPGDYTETTTAILKDGMALIGADTASTRVYGAGTWELTGSPRDIYNNRLNYLIAVTGAGAVTISRIRFSSADTTRRLNGAIWSAHSSDITIHECFFTEFYWNGVCMLQVKNLQIFDCTFYNACMQRDGWAGGQILTKWLHNADIHHNRIIRDGGEDGYGYKAQDGGHRGAKIHHNFFKGHYFSIESAHDAEYDFEIYENTLHGAISVPKHNGGPEIIPDEHTFGVWIHHNIMHDSYAIEGPRNHLRVEHNYIAITKTGGRVYTQHQESVCRGPVWINNNVITNLDRGFVWAHGAGRAKNFHIYNNTVFCADAGDRTGAILGIPDSSENWRFHNNIVVAPAGKPRVLYGSVSTGERVVTATHNVFVNVGNVPAGNWNDVSVGLQLSGEKPYPHYAPESGSSFVVDRGTDLGFAFEGAAPDIGAYEWAAAVARAPKSRGLSLIRPGVASTRPALTLTTNASRIEGPVGIFTLRGRLVEPAGGRSGKGLPPIVVLRPVDR